MTKRSFCKLAVFSSAIVAIRSRTSLRAADQAKVDGKNIRLEFDSKMHSRAIARFDGKEIVLGPFTASETVTIDGAEVTDFALSGSKQANVHDPLGAGKQTTLTGTAGTVQKTVVVTVYDRFPQMAFFNVKYTNKGSADVRVTGWSNNRYSISAREGDAAPAFWSYESGSYEKRPDWVVPLKVNFKQENYLGMNDTDYGGGTPIVDVWRKDVGLGVGLLEAKPRLISLPVSMPNMNQARVAVQYKRDLEILPGESIHTYRSFVAVHDGDYFRTLLAFRKLMSKQGFQMASAPADARSGAAGTPRAPRRRRPGLALAAGGVRAGASRRLGARRGCGAARALAGAEPGG